VVEAPNPLQRSNSKEESKQESSEWERLSQIKEADSSEESSEWERVSQFNKIEEQK